MRRESSDRFVNRSIKRRGCRKASLPRRVMTKRPQNQCKRCGNEWFPRGKNVSIQCPHCRSRSVSLVKEPPLHVLRRSELDDDPSFMLDDAAPSKRSFITVTRVVLLATVAALAFGFQSRDSLANIVSAGLLSGGRSSLIVDSSRVPREARAESAVSLESAGRVTSGVIADDQTCLLYTSDAADE